MRNFIIFLNIFFTFFSFTTISLAQTGTEKDLEGMTLEEILEEERKSRSQKVDDFLEAFDKGASSEMDKRFNELVQEKEFVDEDEISTESFEEFNNAFDEVIEEDLADFKMFEIDTSKLDDGLILPTEQEEEIKNP